MGVQTFFLIEKANDLTTSVFSTGFFVVHDTVGGSQHNVSKLLGWKNVINPVFELIDLDIEARTDDTTLVNASAKFDNDLASTVIIDDFEFSDVA